MTNDGIERIVKSSQRSGQTMGMCEMNLGTMEAQSFMINHMDELFQLMEELNYQHLGRLIKDILGEGLLEIRMRASENMTMTYYEVMTGISLASYARMLLALDAAGKHYFTDQYWKEDDKPGMRIVPIDRESDASQTDYIDRIAERVDIGRNWIKKVTVE